MIKILLFYLSGNSTLSMRYLLQEIYFGPCSRPLSAEDVGHKQVGILKYTLYCFKTFLYLGHIYPGYNILDRCL